jgi:hypothetical protein
VWKLVPHIKRGAEAESSREQVLRRIFGPKSEEIIGG